MSISDEGREVDIYQHKLEQTRLCDIYNYRSCFFESECYNHPLKDIERQKSYNITYLYRMLVEKLKWKIFLLLKTNHPNCLLVRRLISFYNKTVWCNQSGKRKYVAPECSEKKDAALSEDAYNFMIHQHMHYHVIKDLLYQDKVTDLRSTDRDLSAALHECYKALDQLEKSIVDVYYSNNGYFLQMIDAHEMKFLEALLLRRSTAFDDILSPGKECLFLTKDYNTAIKNLADHSETKQQIVQLLRVTSCLKACARCLFHLEFYILKSYERLTCLSNQTPDKLQFVKMLKNIFKA